MNRQNRIIQGINEIHVLQYYKKIFATTVMITVLKIVINNEDDKIITIGS